MIAESSVAASSNNDVAVTSDTDVSDSAIYQKFTLNGLKSHVRKRSISENFIKNCSLSPQISRRITAAFGDSSSQNKSKIVGAKELRNRLESSKRVVHKKT